MAEATSSLSDALASIEDVGGWITEAQAATLFTSARRCEPGSQIVEIGSFHGRSTIMLAAGASESVLVTAIDPYAGSDRGPREPSGYAEEAEHDLASFNDNLARAGVAGRVRHLRMFSTDALPEISGDVELLHIDGAHRHRDARADIRSWGSRVAPGGTMLIHDAFSSVGVTSAIARELLGGSRFRYVGRSRSLAVYRADLSGDVVERIKNGFRQLVQFPWFAKNLVIKIFITAGLGRVAASVGRPVPTWPY